MRRLLSLLSAAALFATPAISQARGFDSDFSAEISGPIKLEVVLSKDLAHRANNLPEKLSDRGSGRLNSSFSNNGRYGEEEISDLIDHMNEELVADFAKQGIVLSETASTILRVTIEDAKPNRPTFNQLKKEPFLSYDSISIGGAEISAEITSATGEVIGQAEYDYFTSLSDHPFGPIGTWQDTRSAFARFSKKLSKKLGAAGASTSS